MPTKADRNLAPRSGAPTLELEPAYAPPRAADPGQATAIRVTGPSPAETTPREPFPLVLQRRAPAAIRTHAWRSALRILVLLANDATVLLGLRSIYRGLREDAWLGDSAAALVRVLIPHGTFPIVQSLVATVVGLAVFGNYRAGDHRRNPITLLSGAALGLSLVFWPQLWGRTPWPTWIGFAAALATIGGGFVASRLLLDVVVRPLRRTEQRAARTLVVGSSDVASQVLQSHALRGSADYNVVGFLDPRLGATGDALGQVASIIEAQRIDTILLAGVTSERHFHQIVNVADAAGCNVQVMPVEFLWRGELEPKILRRRGTPIVQLTRPSVRGPQLAAKRAFDVTVSAAVLLLMSPILAGIGLAVRLTSPGPALFRQVRVGRGGRRFFIYKFRTMYVNADAQRARLASQSMYGDMRLFKLERDPRVTALGAILRRTSLDELPQLWNVLKGEMSLVGPRPPMPSEVELYEEHHYSRFEMKPGITGPWQVNGRNEITDFEEVVRLETRYMRQWSLVKDVAILLRTLPVVFRMRGAH